jgi:membrane associated rhomboid family serine protease
MMSRLTGLTMRILFFTMPIFRNKIYIANILYKHMFKTYFVIPYCYLVLMLFTFALQTSIPSITDVFALFPRDFNYLPGIITTVFLHANAEHLASNILPLCACLFGLFYFYRDIALKVTLICHLLTGILIWIFARPAFHIGASGLAYALVFFILISGIIRRNKRLMVFAFAVLVFQSGLIWGIFPQGNNISWESHLMGAATGVFLAVIFRSEGPQADKPVEWDDEPEDPEPEDEYTRL